ncbi:MAG: amidase [Holophagaceae bacterium]|nr:amidase [Holophagaceae bacterium]
MPKQEPSSGLDRRTFLAAGAALGTSALRAAPKAKVAPSLEEATCASLAAGLASGVWTSEALILASQARIRKLDGALHAVIELNPEALAIARALDRERQARGPRGPLHGLPILVKDNLDSADRMKTTAGSLALLDAPIPARDAFVLARLRAAGAVLLGKTNLSEWANFRSSHSLSGWSARGGQTRNPHALDRNPSGSSSGSAAAVAAAFCVAAVGTETDGSIVSPSAACGIVGLKPTLGLLSRAGIVPLAHSQDTPGPMTRTVRDAALLLSAMAGADPRDPATAAAQGRVEADYTRFLDAGGLKGARLGFMKNLRERHPGVDAVMAAACAALKAHGAELVDVELKDDAYGDAELEVLLYEFKADLDAYLAARGGKMRSMADVIAFNDRERAREMPWFGQEWMLQAVQKGPLTEPAYLKALEACRKLSREGIDGLMDAQRLDAIIGPTSGPAALIDVVNGDRGGLSCSSPAAVAGYPHLTVPAGLVHGLPVGLSFFGRAWSEPVLLRLGYAFEQATKARRTPAFHRTLPI